MNREDKQGWNPYIAGALTGLLLVLSVWAAGKYVGASTTFVRSAGYIERVFTPERVAGMDYFKKKQTEDRLAVSLRCRHLYRSCRGFANDICSDQPQQNVPSIDLHVSRSLLSIAAISHVFPGHQCESGLFHRQASSDDKRVPRNHCPPSTRCDLKQRRSAKLHHQRCLSVVRVDKRHRDHQPGGWRRCRHRSTHRQEISLLHHLSESDQFISKIIGGKRLG